MPGARPYRRRIRLAMTRMAELGKAVFGDRRGVALFLVALLVHAFTWRAGVFITDTYTIVNGLVAVSEGQLEISRIVYGPEGGVTPGMHYVDGNLYPRNYGQIVLALPFLWLLEGVAAVADLRIALAAMWSLGLFLVIRQIGHLVNHHWFATLAGSMATLGLFVGNIFIATDLTVPGLHLLALQTQTMVAVALTGVVVYRLVTAVASRRVGLTAGVAVSLASPLGFWATYPKRHALVALFVACVAYWLVRHRQTGKVGYRALAYGAVGVVAWIHAAEALVLFVVLATVDLVTARQNDPRTLVVITGAFALSLMPMLVTNWFVAGDFLRPPRLLPSYNGNQKLDSITLFLASITISGTVPVPVLNLGPFGRLLDFLVRGLRVIITEPEQLYHIFIRSGYIPSVAAEDGGEAITLSLLESMPLAGALVSIPVLLIRGLRNRKTDTRLLSRTRSHLQTPAGTVDAFTVVFLLLFTLLYVPRLPIHASITVRYLVPVVPLLTYAVARLSVIQSAAETEYHTLGWMYTASTLIGGQLLMLVVLRSNLTLGEAVQLHAVVALGTAALLVFWTLGSQIAGRDTPCIGAVCLGLAAGATTVFLLLSGLVYFSYAGEYVLPIANWLNYLLSL